MAEAGVPEAESGDTESDVKPIQKVSLLLNRKPCTVTLTHTHLSWMPESAKKKGTGSVRVPDIVTVRNGAAPEPGDNTSQLSELTIVYIEQQKNLVLKRREVTLTGDAVMCNSLYTGILNSLSAVSDRPRKLLVLINPMSGGKQAPSIYRSKVAPIFEEANIETDVILTERARHAKELLMTYDIKSVDGVVVVSGDGLYHEFANAMVQRMAAETGSDVNNTDFVPSEFPLPVGIIPCGTGNGIARGTYGNLDVETAALTIVLGYRTKKNLMTVYSDIEFIGISILMVAYGYWGDFVFKTEQTRHLSKFRKIVAMMQMLFITGWRLINLDIGYKCKGTSFDELNKENLQKFSMKTNIVASSGDTEQKPGSPMNADTKDKVGTEMNWFSCMCTGLCTLCARVDFDDSTLDARLHGAKDVAVIMGNKPCSLIQLMKLMWNLSVDPTVVVANPPESVSIFVASEHKVSLSQPSDAGSDRGLLERCLNIDGELVTLKKPEYSVKLFPQRVPLYCNLPKVTGRVSET